MTVFKIGPRAVAIAVLAATIAGCSSQLGGGLTGPSADPVAIANEAATTSHYDKAVQAYIRAASQANDPETRRQYRFEAGLAAAQGGDSQTARQMLASIDPSTLSPTDRARYNLAQREVAIADLPPYRALSQLPRPADNTPPEVAQHVWEKRADLYFADNDPVEGIHALVQRGIWLTDDRAMRANDNRLYNEALDAIALGIGPDSPSAQTRGPAVRGWLALADIGQSQFESRGQRDQALAQWQSAYPGHPANRTVLAERFNYSGSTDVVQPPDQATEAGSMTAPQPPSDQVALAVPTSGSFQSAAKAIRSGFMFAYENNSDGLPQPIVYDSSSMAPRQLLAQAEADNVGVLVGPLDKSKVAAISQLSLSMPEIALNTTDNASSKPGFYQFGLAPEDEAAAAARHAEQAGYQRALALVPNGDWGSRVLDAFRQTFEQQGGRLVGYKSYNGNTHDHSQAIQSVLSNYGSGANADFIFVAAQPTQARLIRAQLKYYRASGLPMIATSHAFSGRVDRDQDIDLNSVHFVDMPWLLGQGGTIQRLRSEAASAYGNQATAYARLFAMGMDAWLLARRTERGGLSPDDPIEGMSGVLSVAPDGRVHRYLGWAVFRNGVPQTLSMPSLDDARRDRIERQSSTKTLSGSASETSTPRRFESTDDDDPWADGFND